LQLRFARIGHSHGRPAITISSSGRQLHDLAGRQQRRAVSVRD
jgi:hypothetical protein